MFRDTQQAERRCGAPNHEISFISQWKIEVIRKLAMDYGEEHHIFVDGFAFGIGAVAEDEAEGIGRLMPCSSLLHWIRFLGLIFDEARKFKGVGKIGGCEAIAKEFRKGAAADGGICRVGEIVVDVGFTRGWEEGKPILFDAGTSGRRVAGEFCERRVGFEGTEGGVPRRGGEEIL